MDTLWLYVFLLGIINLTTTRVAGSDSSVPYPTKGRLTYEEFHNVMFNGGADEASGYLYEISANRNHDNPAILTKLLVQWHKKDGKYYNTYGGWYPDVQMCINGTFPMEAIHGKYVEYKFPDSMDDINIGTIVSSHPKNYIISWYCPEAKLVDRKFCRDDTRMTIMTFDPRPDRVPWQNIVKDLCKNKLPQPDDARWKFTWEETIRCGMEPLDTSVRKKREASSEKIIRGWP